MLHGISYITSVFAITRNTTALDYDCVVEYDVRAIKIHVAGNFFRISRSSFINILILPTLFQLHDFVYRINIVN